MNYDDYLTAQPRRWDIIDHATRVTDAGRSWWAFDYAARRLDRATNVASVPTMGRAVASMLEPAGRKRAGGTLHGGPYGKGKSASQRVVDTALVISWRSGGWLGIPRDELIRRTADALRVSGIYAPSESTVAARIGEQIASTFGAFEVGAFGHVYASAGAYGRLRVLGAR